MPSLQYPDYLHGPNDPGTFDVYTELAGYPKAILHMSCVDHDNMDVVMQIRKIDKSGKQLAHLNYPCPVPMDQVPDVNTAKTLGPQGFLRAAHHVSKNDHEGPVSSNDLSREMFCIAIVRRNRFPRERFFVLRFQFGQLA